jgi:hypothetical protein
MTCVIRQVLVFRSRFIVLSINNKQPSHNWWKSRSVDIPVPRSTQCIFRYSSSSINPVYPRNVNSSYLGDSLSSYRQSYIGLVFNSRVIDLMINNPHSSFITPTIIYRSCLLFSFYRKYRSDCNNNPPSVVSFMTCISSTSGRLHSQFIRLLFLQTHRETDRFFGDSGVLFSFRNPTVDYSTSDTPCSRSP